MSNARANRARETLGGQALRALSRPAPPNQRRDDPDIAWREHPKGNAVPNAEITTPPSAGPAARPDMKPTPLAAVALSRSCLGTSIGVVDPQAGEVSAPPTPSRKVVPSSSAGVARSRETRPAKAAETARMATSTAISRRRESMVGQGARRKGEQEQRQADRDLNQLYCDWIGVQARD